MNRTQVLQQAGRLISNDRAEEYGDAMESFERTANFWSLYLGHPVTANDVANMMILIKTSRLSHQPTHLDSLVDIAGYAALAVELATEK